MPSLDLERKLLFLIPEDWYVCSHRLPLIATDATGCREICLDRVNRLQVKPRDVESIVTAVTTLADDP